MEDVRARHRKEQRELQSKITQKKKNTTKKARKAVNDECEVLQRELYERQQIELAALEVNSTTTTDDVHNLDNEGHADEATTNQQQRQDTGSSSLAQEIHMTLAGTPQKRPNRQKARLARRAAEQESHAAAAAEEARHQPDVREQELEAMKAHMDKHHLVEVQIRPDGHCLYSAVATNIPIEAVRAVSGSAAAEVQYQFIRNETGTFILQHPEDFEAFLEEPLDQYVRKIKHTAEWGGQLELQAIARAFRIPVYVLQADGRVEKIEPEGKSKYGPIWLAYYRHSFGLGEHYNALKNAER